MEANLGCMLLWDLSSGATSAFLTVHIPGSVLFGIALKKVYFLEIHCSHVGPDTQMPHLQTVFFIKSIAVHLLCFEFSSLYFSK